MSRTYMTEEERAERRKANIASGRQRRKKLLFIKSAIISSLIFSVVFFGGLYAYNSLLLTPPEIPVPPAAEVINYDRIAFFFPEPDEEDKLVGGGLTAPEGFTTEDRKDDFFTFLIFGTDKGGNTDTIMVASYDGVLKEAHIIGIPRDIKVNVRRNLKKINAAYPAGRAGGGSIEDGVAQLQREIKTVIGFVPDFYVSINYNAFIKLVDAVDGVDVHVPINMVLNDPDQNLYINIPRGDRTLNGEDALKFARYRDGNIKISDYQRIENQHAVIQSVLQKLLRPESLLKIQEFVDIFNENVNTDIRLADMPWFVYQLDEIRGADALNTHTLPTNGNSGLPMYYEYVDAAKTIELINSTINPFKKDIQISDLDIAGR